SSFSQAAPTTASSSTWIQLRLGLPMASKVSKSSLLPLSTRRNSRSLSAQFSETSAELRVRFSSTSSLDWQAREVRSASESRTSAVKRFPDTSRVCTDLFLSKSNRTSELNEPSKLSNPVLAPRYRLSTELLLILRF